MHHFDFDTKKATHTTACATCHITADPTEAVQHLALSEVEAACC